MFIEIKKLNEAGCEEALFGMGLSFGLTSPYKNFDDCPIEVQEKLYERAKLNAPLDKGHNKFLEHIDVWLDVIAPRYWWQEADTYRLTTKQSESTMHTLNKRFKTTFVLEEIQVLFEDSRLTSETFDLLSYYAQRNDLYNVKQILPEGFLQRREWKLSYKTLREIVLQRYNHRLPHWKTFCNEILNQINHPEFLGIDAKK